MPKNVEEIVRIAGAILLFAVFIPCSVLVAIAFYRSFDASELRGVTMVMAGGLAVSESILLPLAVAAHRLRLWGRVAGTALTIALLLLPFDIIVEVGAFSTHFKKDESNRAAAVAQFATARNQAAALEGAIRELRASMPETLRAKPAAALEAELRGVDTRLAQFAIPPPALIRSKAALESALATRQAIDDQTAALSRTRAVLAAPEPAGEHPAVALLGDVLQRLGHPTPPDYIRGFFSIALVLVLKVTTVMLAWNVVDRQANPAGGGTRAAAAPPAGTPGNAPAAAPPASPPPTNPTTHAAQPAHAGATQTAAGSITSATAGTAASGTTSSVTASVGATFAGPTQTPSASAPSSAAATGQTAAPPAAKGVARPQPGLAAALKKALGGKRGSP